MSQASGLPEPQKLVHEITPRDVTVAAIEHLNDDYVRLLFRGESLRNFTSPAFDDHVKLVFENAHGDTVRRNYTPILVKPEKAELAIDIALHTQGEAISWLTQLKVGDSATIAGPRMSLLVSNDYLHYWMIADATALPAVNRKLAELSQNASVTLYLLGKSLEGQVIRSNASVSIRSFENNDELLAAVVDNRSTACTSTFVWAAAEHAVTQTLKQIINHPKAHTRIASYWRSGEHNYHQELSL